MAPVAPFQWVPCVFKGCKFRAKVYGERERGLKSTFYRKPTTYDRLLPKHFRPAAVACRQRYHLKHEHEKSIVIGTPEHRLLRQAQKRLQSKRFRAEGNTAAEVTLSRRKRTNFLRTVRYDKSSRLFHLEQERLWEVSKVLSWTNV